MLTAPIWGRSPPKTDTCSSTPAYSPSIRDVGISAKTIFDCTVPFALKDRFRRAPFMELDPEKWLHG